MADKPIATPLPADLPENWQAGQIVAPTGEEVGLTHQHGYNYLMEMVNRVQRGVNTVNEAFANVSGKRTCRFVVGTSTAGWTEADCDYLCDGEADEVEIKAAINALPASGGEIVILGGTYKLSASISISGPRGDLALVGEPGSTVLEGGKISTNGVDGDFMLSVQGLTISDGYLSALNTSLSVTGCRLDNSSISSEQSLSGRTCNFLCTGNIFDRPSSDDSGRVLAVSTFSMEKIQRGCVITDNIFKISSAAVGAHGSIDIYTSLDDTISSFSGNVIFSEIKTSLNIYGLNGIAVNGNYLYNCDIKTQNSVSIFGNRITNGDIIASILTSNGKDALSISGNVINSGQIFLEGAGAITGNSVITNPSAANPAAIILKKIDSSQPENFQSSVVGNFLYGGQYGILLKNPLSTLFNRAAAYALINSNRIYESTTPIRIESEWSSCMVTDNVFETGAITDLGTNNIVRFNSDDDSTGGGSGGGTTAGVTKFNGRTGAVLPQSGDYTAAMVGAIPAGQVQAIQALTQTEYDALASKSAGTLYLIKE